MARADRRAVSTRLRQDASAAFAAISETERSRRRTPAIASCAARHRAVDVRHASRSWASLADLCRSSAPSAAAAARRTARTTATTAAIGPAIRAVSSLQINAGLMGRPPDPVRSAVRPESSSNHRPR